MVSGQVKDLSGFVRGSAMRVQVTAVRKKISRKTQQNLISFRSAECPAVQIIASRTKPLLAFQLQLTSDKIYAAAI